MEIILALFAMICIMFLRTCGYVSCIGDIISIKHAKEQNASIKLPLISIILVICGIIFFHWPYEKNNEYPEIYVNAGVAIAGYIAGVICNMVSYLMMFVTIDRDKEQRNKTRYVVIPIVVIIVISILIMCIYQSADWIP